MIRPRGSVQGNQHLPGDEVWLVREERGSGERNYYLSNLPAEVTLRQLAATIKARWICEQAHQHMKEELSLDHFQADPGPGYQYALMTMMAYAFLQSRRLAAANGKERIASPPPQPSMPAIRQAILHHLSRPLSRRCPHCDADLDLPP